MAPASGAAFSKRYTLAECVALADRHAGSIQSALHRLAQAHAQLDEVLYLPWTQFNMSSGLYMVPQLRGSAVYSPENDISVSSRMGAVFRFNFEGVLPLYTFDKISSGTAAARAQVELAEADIQKVRNVVRHDVRRAFFQVQLARDARYLLEQARSRLAEAIAHAEESEDIDEADVLKLKSYQFEVQARSGEIDKNEKISLGSLRMLTGTVQGEPFDIPDEPIQRPKAPLIDVTVYLRSARLNRPEVRQVAAGLRARTAQVNLARARMLPDLGATIFAGYAYSPMVTDQTNPYVLDNYNYFRYGAGAVFRWNLDLLPAAARLRFAEAQLSEMRDTERFALGGIGFEVESAWAAARDAETRERAFEQAEKLAKRWVANVSAGIAVGTREDKDVVDPLRSYLTNRFAHLQAILDLDVAMSQLALATGDESLAAW